MEIAICSDIHGNLPALERFLEETQSADKRIFLGDVVGYCGPYPNECLELVKEEFDYILSGNHDRMVSTESVDERYQERSWLNEGIVKSIELSSSGTREFLRDTPEEMNIALDGEGTSYSLASV
jgi:predicted phosphodiesterase